MTPSYPVVHDQTAMMATYIKGPLQPPPQQPQPQPPPTITSDSTTLHCIQHFPHLCGVVANIQHKASL
ncbi:hypothetical protein K504DRAFT_458602 [Pleomassaria siparia CBS 279.74]|uniref:Uncharacterized protein n=1 Tax=Pleomassaria siparia CBS 279.74 TaxID=1314801 RepID=A0A6G1K2R8_9PLEO|nr:hypothetical protein K504DRAFT_458602 [Pleomassaria siparia CBS 279.74]